uniref:glycerol-3-phosphate dehydrogenase n=1 Tax=Alexandrium monilatum TaxID=311494 RepID=A0A7S4VR92_9DINO
MLRAGAGRVLQARSRAGAASGLARAFSEEAAPAQPTRRRRGLILLGGAAGSIACGAAYVKVRRDKVMRDAEAAIRNTEEKPVPPRMENLKRLQSGEEEFDLLVVGGGCTGAGVALEAQLRGLKVACVEQEDFASGTSSKSTKLLWAGSRYLVKGLVKLFSLSSLKDPVGSVNEFLGTWHMVMGCFRERTYMLTMNPHITNWVPIAVPLDKWIIWPPPFDYPLAALGPMTGLFVIFFKFYDALSLWTAPSSYVMSSSRAREEFPQMDGKRMKYVSVFYEGAHNDARTNLSIALTAAMHGTCILNYARVSKILFDPLGVACGAVVVDKAEPNAKPFTVKAKKVVYAGGPFTDGLRELSEGKDVKPVVNGSGGTHIVLPPYYCPRHMGMVDMMTSRGSFLFFLPWEGYTLVGTTDVKTKPDLHHEVPEDEIQYLINECEKYLSPSLEVRRRDVMSAWYGIRPLAVDPNAKDMSSASRDHVVSHHPTNGITFISGGKWTTWREMAEDCVDQVLNRSKELRKKAGPSKSLTTPLIGAGKTKAFPEGWHENLAVRLSQRFDLAFDVAQHLAKNYGTRATDVLQCVEEDKVKGSRSGLYKHYPRLYEGAAATTGYPYLEAEVRYAMDHEYACTPADILARRTRLAFLNSTAARLSLPRVVEIMAERFGWDQARQLEEHEKAERVLARDFAGPAPNKQGATLRTACTADVKDIFDKIDTTSRGSLSKEGIDKAAKELGFPLTVSELQQAMNEMDVHKKGEVSFPEFLAWWNSSQASKALQSKIFMGVRVGSKWATVQE